jgi:tRNA(Ile)-lysidine synthase
LAVSGGADSTALLVLAARWRKTLEQGPRLVAVTIDHGLRPGSGQEAAAVAQLAASLGVEHRTLCWRGTKPSTGIQEAARKARYRLLAAAAREVGACHVATAHTLDDQAETVLFRLARGSGPAGLAAMARVAPLPFEAPPKEAASKRRWSEPLVLVRPFLGVPKARLVATLEAEGIPFFEDPSNRDPRFARTRLRALMPAFAREGLDAARWALLARRVARAEAAIERAVDEAAQRLSLTHWSKSGPIVLDAQAFAALADEVALRLVGRAIHAVGREGPVELGKLEALFDALCDFRRSGLSNRFRRTLAGAVVTLTQARLVIERAPPRRAGRTRRRRCEEQV